MIKDIAISVVRPKNYVHSDCFNPVISCLCHALKIKGYNPEVLFNVYTSDKPSIIIGAHLLDKPSELADLKKSVIYNFEQISPESHWISKDYFQALLARPYIDYSIANINSAFAINRNIVARHLPFAYESPMDYSYVTRDAFRVKPKDIDVLFFGSMNDRRAKVIDQLKNMGLNVQAVFGVYGPELSVLIHRSKVVLNMHYYESSIFEAVRVLPLLASRIPVISEQSVDDSDYSYLNPPFGIQCATYESLASTCKVFVEDSDVRALLADTGYSNVKLKTMSQSIENIASLL